MIRLTALLWGTLLVISFSKRPTQLASSIHATPRKAGITTGADQTQQYVPYLQGKRIGLVANQSSIIGKKSSVDSLLSLGINIVKVFGPDHAYLWND
jgi:uncharacterized protein YbbC (DUF1343 family)